MSDQLQIEYRGYAIHFAENQEVWRCAALDVDAEKISTVKRKIDKIISASRKIPIDRNAIYVDYHNNVVDIRIVAFAQPRKDDAEPTELWCMMPDKERYFDHGLKKSAFRDVEVRKKLSLTAVYADTPENREVFAEMVRLEAARQQIHEQIKTEKAKATTVNLADLKTESNDVE